MACVKSASSFSPIPVREPSADRDSNMKQPAAPNFFALQTFQAEMMARATKHATMLHIKILAADDRNKSGFQVEVGARTIGLAVAVFRVVEIILHLEAEVSRIGGEADRRFEVHESRADIFVEFGVEVLHAFIRAVTH